jgi:tetratricopeptide (TPR) repeat protein
MPVKGLKKAERLFRLKKFRDVVNCLQPEIFKYRESFRFYYYLGVSCLHTNDASGAVSYLGRASRLKDDDENTLVALAAAHLLKFQTGDAIKTYLAVLDLNPRNARARRGLDLVRKGLASHDVTRLVESGRIRRLFPRTGPLPMRYFLVPLASLALACAVFFAATALLRTGGTPRPEIAAYTLPDDALNLIDLTGTYRYTLTSGEVKASFARAREHLNAYRDNLALVELNRILNSNASYQVKTLCQTIKKFALKPDFSNIRDSFPLKVVLKDPLLYVDCSVSWKGKVGSLSATNEEIRFDLWVGDTNEFEGVAPVVLNFASDVANAQTVEVLGEVSSSGDNVLLKGRVIHRLY